MVRGPPTKPKTPSDLAGLARILVRFGRLRLGSRTPALSTLYQRLPAATIKYTYMKHPFTKTLILAAAMICGCLAMHLAIGTFSY